MRRDPRARHVDPAALHQRFQGRAAGVQDQRVVSERIGVAERRAVQAADAGPGRLVVVTVTAAYTARLDDDVILSNATGAAFTVTLPPAVSAQGRQLVIKKTDASGNAVTVDADGSETIDGAATYALAAQWKFCRFVSSGTAWLIAGNN